MSSNEIREEAQGGREREVGVVVDPAPVATVPPVAVISPLGMRGMPVLITPYQSQSDGRTSSANANGSEMSTEVFQAFLLHKEEVGNHEAYPSKMVKEAPAWMTLLATIAASVTYQAGLSPPGGIWQADDGQGHNAGTPVLRDQHWLRYQVFYYLNATAFVTSLAMIMALLSDQFYATERRAVALKVTTCINAASLIGAYAAGSTLSSTSTILVFVITCLAFVGIIFIEEYAHYLLPPRFFNSSREYNSVLYSLC